MTDKHDEQKATSILRKIGIALFWFLIWQLLAMLLNRGLLIAVPTPITTLEALIRLGKTGELYMAAGLSFLRILIGYLAAVLLGIIGAVLASRFSLFAQLTEPMLRVMRAVPVASFIILIFLWFDKDTIPSLIAFVTVVPVVWGELRAGLSRIDRQLIEMATVMGLPRRKILLKIILPALMPALVNACVTGLGFAWKSGVSAEVICRSNLSLGNMLWVEKNAIAYDEVFAITAVIVILSVILERVVKMAATMSTNRRIVQR